LEKAAERECADEHWAPIGSAFPGYEASDQGRIRRGDQEVRPFFGRGQLWVNLWHAAGRWSPQRVTTLIATAFIPNPKGLECVRRRDTSKPFNARAENLYWAEWPKDATASPAVSAKQKAGLPSLTDDQVRDIRTRYARGGITLKSLAQYHQTTISVVRGAIVRRTYKHVE